MLVPVKPVWETADGGQAPPRMSKRSPPLTQPRPRQPTVPPSPRRPGVWHLSASRRSAAGTGPASEELTHQAAKRARSATVPNNPACPATPPITRAFSSCTTPVHGLPSSRNSVAANRDGGPGGRKHVSAMPSGPLTTWRNTVSRGEPMTAETISPSAMKPRSEYATRVPGAASSGVANSASSSPGRLSHHS